MNRPVFCEIYADLYDRLYTDKDYGAECDIIEKIFRQYSNGQVNGILDLGCGTGNHAILLAQRGYSIVGVDISIDMLKHARAKANNAVLSNAQIAFVQGDVRSLELHNQFDAVVMMFAVLGYQTNNNDVLAALCGVKRHLKPQGLFICDVWYGPSVLTQRPEARVKVSPTPEGKVIRTARCSLEISEHLAKVQYHLWHISGDHLVKETEEEHTMRYFFPKELELFFEIAGLELLSLRSFDEPDKPASENTWNVVVVGKNQKSKVA